MIQFDTIGGPDIPTREILIRFQRVLLEFFPNDAQKFVLPSLCIHQYSTVQSSTKISPGPLRWQNDEFRGPG